MTVGRSWRSLAKHQLMGNFLGQEVGAINMLARKGKVKTVRLFLTKRELSDGAA